MNYPIEFAADPAPPGELDANKVKQDFPILQKSVRGRPLVYLDNGATSQKPNMVIEAVSNYYRATNANVHRGVHWLSESATAAYELARQNVQQFINAKSSREIIFVRGSTEAINLVAQTYGRKHLGPGDEVLITEMEHHSNIVPWQILCEQTGATLQVVHIDEKGELLQEEFTRKLSEKTKLFAVTHISNALGTVNPLADLIKQAHRLNVPVLVDGAQAVPHQKVDVQALDADFYVFSGHKMYGPTGIGVLYGKLALLEEMPPYQGGGDMISSVSLTQAVYAKPPYRFEAGTPNIAGAIGLGAAAEYLQDLGLSRINAHEKALLAYGTEKLQEINGLRLIGTAAEKAGILSFVLADIHPHDIGTILDQYGIAVRAGHHCAMPVMQKFKIPATTRASLGLYNAKEDIDALFEGLKKVKEVFK